MSLLAGGAAVAWPLAARAQQAERMRRMGLLMGTADDREGQARVLAVNPRLQELGWATGRNSQMATRSAGGRRRPHTVSRSRTSGARATSSSASRGFLLPHATSGTTSP